MKKFDYSALVHTVNKLKKETIGYFINRFFLISEHDFFFDLSRKNHGLFISLNASNPFLDLVTDKISLPRCKKESHLTTILTHHIEKARIVDVTLLEGEKVLTITLSKHYENLTSRTLLMHIELITSHPNLIITDEHFEIIGLFKASKDFSGDRILRIGQTYKRKQVTTPFRLISTDQTYNYVAKYLDETRLQILKKNHEKLFHHVSSSLKRLLSKKEKIKEEINILPSTETANTYGQLLLTYLPSITTEEITLDGLTFNVDPSYDAVKNANMWFTKAKKSRASYLNKREQLTIIERELAYYETLSKQILTLNDDELSEVALELNLLKLPKSRQNQAPTFKPYYVMYNNVKIGFGKNNLQNDYLSFKLANKSDTFMHIKDYQGSHLVIFHPNPGKELLEFTARLGLLLAKVPSAEFTYTKIKDIKKGQFPGQVIYKDKAQSFYIKSDDKITYTILNEAKRF